MEIVNENRPVEARIAEEADSAENDGKGNGSAAAVAVAKPGPFDLNKFKSKRADAIANVDTLQTGLPISSMSQAKDFVRLHPDEENYWSPELCFVMVPIKGAKRDSLHLIDEDLAMRLLPSGKIMRFRLALATKPHDVFFLCRIPTRNLDNSWNRDNIAGCERAKTLWTQATSRGEEGIDGLSLPEIKSGRIDGANLRGVGWARYGQRPAQHATLVHPCSAIGACEHHCNIFGTIPAGGEDAARRRQRHGQDNPVGSNR
jgi:hypothetical protein